MNTTHLLRNEVEGWEEVKTEKHLTWKHPNQCDGDCEGCLNILC